VGKKDLIWVENHLHGCHRNSSIIAGQFELLKLHSHHKHCSNSTVQNLHSLTDFTGSGTYTGTSVYILYQCWLCLRFHHNMPIAHAELHRFPGMLPYNLQIMEKKLIFCSYW